MAKSSTRIREALKDPVVRFIGLGLLIFAAHEALDRDTSDEPIVVSTRFVEGLAREHHERFGRAPSPSERDELVRRFVREEVLVRQARELGLDRTDPIVRRRLAQKMELALRSRTDIPRPTDDELRRWIAANPDAVATDERFSFRHAFVSRDAHGEDARTIADAIAAQVRASEDPATKTATLGDAFVLGPTIEHATADLIAERFGGAMRDAVASCAVGAVCGPVESRFGFHVVVATGRDAAGSLPFRAARPIAERAILRAREDAALEREIDRLVDEQGVDRVDDGDAR